MADLADINTATLTTVGEVLSPAQARAARKPKCATLCRVAVILCCCLVLIAAAAVLGKRRRVKAE